MEKKRAERGTTYWAAYMLSKEATVICYKENGRTEDFGRFSCGNYFATREEAEMMARKLRAVLAGAEVIQMPSEAEILDAAEGHIEACDEEGHPYSDKYDAKAAFVNGAEWLKSKIIK